MTRTGFDPQLAALGAGLPLRRLGHARLRRVAAARGRAHVRGAGRRRSHGCIDDARRDGRPHRGPLDGRPDRAAHRAPPSRSRALARAARLEPGVRARRHRPRGVEAAAPRRARRRRRRRRAWRSRCCARSWRPASTPEAVAAAVAASMSRISADGLRAAVECLPTHDVRDRLGEIDAPTLVLVGEHDDGDAALVRRGARRRHPRRDAADHPGRRPHREPGGARTP